MKFELTSDKKVLIVTDENGSKQLILVELIQKNLTQLLEQRDKQMKAFDKEIDKLKSYAKAAGLKS